MSAHHHIRSHSFPSLVLHLPPRIPDAAVTSSLDMRHDAAQCEPKRNWCQKSEATLNSRENCNLCSTGGTEELDKAMSTNKTWMHLLTILNQVVVMQILLNSFLDSLIEVSSHSRHPDTVWDLIRIQNPQQVSPRPGLPASLQSGWLQRGEWLHQRWLWLWWR